MRIIMCFLLGLAALPALAEWTPVSESADGRVTYYVDYASIRKDGNLRKVWEIQDLKQRDSAGAMSRRVRYEYDCEGEQARLLAASKHSEPMAKGETIWSSEGDVADEWYPIPPESAADFMLKQVCAK